jgi:sensor histidine kinase regulating citrate/malate metabolism
MGLYMSKMIIEKIGGKIEAKNIENGVMIEIKVPKEK